MTNKVDATDRRSVLNCILRIFSESAESAHIDIDLIGGMTNKNFLVTVNDKKYVLRIPGNGTEGMIERGNEYTNTAQSCRLGITPAIVYYDKTAGIKLAEYIDNAETLRPATIKHKDNIEAVVSTLKTLHSSHIELANEFNIFNEIHKYERLMLDSGAVMYDGHQTVRKAVLSLQETINQTCVMRSPCHNDPVPENFIKSPDGKVYLIDWEYSGMNDPLSDLAALLLESDFEDAEAAQVLRLYFGESIPQQVQTKILMYQILLDYLWTLWTVIKEAKGDDFGTYGKDRYRRAITNLKRLNRL